MGPWSLIPVVALLLLMRQSYALFLDIRETYRTTVEVLVEAAESQDDRRYWACGQNRDDRAGDRDAHRSYRPPTWSASATPRFFMI